METLTGEAFQNIMKNDGWNLELGRACSGVIWSMESGLRPARPLRCAFSSFWLILVFVD